MIIEERDYRIVTGRTRQFVSLYEEHGLPLQLKYLERLLGYFISEIGELHHVVSLWGFTGLDDRMERRDRMQASDEWKNYLKRVDGLVDVQTSRILRPTSFSPIK
ncbi:hypothetical protein OKW43_007645 [Paraburkholderia sp. WC7.3g]|uniref:NIPSNAP family protein n=1 Tax=Paraburkholderia sp. WC7.3g TaxID=2991070 RepID=UPI003D2112D0